MHFILLLALIERPAETYVRSLWIETLINHLCCDSTGDIFIWDLGVEGDSQRGKTDALSELRHRFVRKPRLAPLS